MSRPHSALPLGALAAGFGLSLIGSSVVAQTTETAPKKVDSALPEVTVQGSKQNTPVAKQSYQVETTTIGKGKQALRDIPQSITVVTEKLIDDRNLDTLKEVLHNTAGVTFQAAEGGEEDIRLRGFSLQQSGDIFIDGTRDPGFYERDTFNLDRLELLRGSASMLFGRGSTGGAVNQVSKTPYLENANQIDTTVGSHSYARVVGDFNLKTSESSALRFNAMKTDADNNGAGSSIDKTGAAGSFRWGIGSADEFQVGLYYLENDNGINYGIPWIKPKASQPNSSNTINNTISPDAYYGMASDYNAGSAKYVTLTNQHRFTSNIELKTAIRQGSFTRDQRASLLRTANTVDLSNISPNTAITRSAQNKIQDLDGLYVQSDLSAKFNTGPVKHTFLSGFDYTKEEKTVYGAAGGPARTPTRFGTPNDGAWINENLRTIRPSNGFEAESWGLYGQDLFQVARDWKLLAGLRYDHLNGYYRTISQTNGTVTSAYKQNVGVYSNRFGALYQPSALQSFHLSYGTSFNTSGDTYSYSAKGANTPPEKSENIELGAKLDTADGRLSTRLALFRSTKTNERNTDPDSVGFNGTNFLLSGKRHVTGIDIDVTGQLTNNWEIYTSYTWMPDAKVDVGTGTSFGNKVGDRPGLTPAHSGTVWSTYKLLPQWRVAAGVNFRGKQSPADINGVGWNAPSYSTLDLMTDYAINKNFTVKGNVTNVENKLYADSLYRGHYVPGVGRLFQVTLSAKF